MNPFPSDMSEAEAINAADRDAAEVELRRAWRDDSEYYGNLRAAREYVESLPPARRAEIEHGLTKDGRQILNSSADIQRLAAEARKPTGALIEAAKKYNGSERAAIEAWMADRRSPYWVGPESEQIQARYRDLVSQEPSPLNVPLASSPTRSAARPIEGETFGTSRHRRG